MKARIQATLTLFLLAAVVPLSAQPLNKQTKEFPDTARFNTISNDALLSGEKNLRWQRAADVILEMMVP